MAELQVGEHRWTVEQGTLLLDALLAAGVDVPYSCRAGSCHACRVRCVQGAPLDAQPHALAADLRAQGWRLACQCRVVDDLQVALFDPLVEGLPTTVCEVHWLGDVLRLRLRPERPLRYRVGQHAMLWLGSTARPYSLASVPGEDDFLEFHIDCGRPGAFCNQARALKVGDGLRLGALRDGALHYDPQWDERPLWLLAAGTGLAPLLGIYREARRQDHRGEIRLLHVVRDGLQAYSSDVQRHEPGLIVQCVPAADLERALALLQPARQTIALLCGSPGSVERFSRRLFIAGMPRSQVLADVFVEPA